MTSEPTQSALPNSRKPVAPLWHSALLVLIFLAIGIGGAALQRQPSVGPGLAPAHRGIVPLYISLIVMEWALVYYVWAGIRRKGVRIVGLVGRWTSTRVVLLDFAIALPFWVLWEATARFVHYLLGPAHAKTVDVLLPQGIVAFGLWIAVSISAGFCEELVFRGYFQKQFHALTGSTTVALISQALLFGLAHAYQGTKAVIVITVLGMLYGLLAAWRKNLLPGIIAHAWSDIYEGFLKFKL